MHPIINIAIRAARKAGDVIVRGLNRLDRLDVTAKGHNDFVTEIDYQAESEIIKIIRRAYPAHAVLAEESGTHGQNEYLWIIDPLDGTTNFLHGFPQFAVSLGVQYRGRLEHAVVYDPMRQELFTASRGAGAQLKERRIRVSGTKTLEASLIGTGFPFREHRHLKDYLVIFEELLRGTAGLRRPGSAALDLAYVAAGRLDGFWEFDLNKWDIAGGALLIQEAGGIVSDTSGGADFMASG
ncbi:MAG TPA: inositol monophosphatase family protein, partial [Gammaproteobacteria bacterium]|nr:inositol monophosphatase family protein [Gammaproteobacteria bacterium]